MRFGSFYGASLAAIAAGVAALATSTTPIVAQEASARTAAFEAVLENPGDPNAMLTYARAAVAERDYEAAVSTLERLLDFEPNHSAARYELAVAYYALGSYEISRFHFLLLQQTGGLDSTRTTLAADYLDRIAREEADQSLVGTASVGLAVTDGEAAAVLGLNLGWTVDLGGTNDSTWQTEFRGRLFEGEDAISTGRFLLRTGPQFSADGFAYGARLRPYVELEAVQDDDDDDYVTASVGVQYLNAHSANWSTFADLSFGTLDGSAGLSDADIWSAVLGASYTPSRDVRIRFSLRAEDRAADVAADSRERLGLRVDYIRAGTGIFGDEDRRWQAGGYIQYDQLDYSGIGRDDTLAAIGLSLRTFLTESSYVEVAASSIRRDSSIASFDETTPVFSVQFGMEF